MKVSLQKKNELLMKELVEKNHSDLSIIIHQYLLRIQLHRVAGNGYRHKP
jgi:hypothetical protein